MGRAPGGRAAGQGPTVSRKKRENPTFLRNARKCLADHARTREWVQTGSQTGPNQGESSRRGGTGMQIYGTMRNRVGAKGAIGADFTFVGISYTISKKIPPKKKVCELGD